MIYIIQVPVQESKLLAITKQCLQNGFDEQLELFTIWGFMQYDSTCGSEDQDLPHMSSFVCIASLLGCCRNMSVVP